MTNQKRLTHTHRGSSPLINKDNPGRDSNPLLRPDVLLGKAGRPGKLEEMIHGHMRVAARVMDVAGMVSSKEWVVSPPEDPTPAEETFTALCKALTSDMRQDVANDVGDLGESLAVAMGSEWFGHWVSELTLYPDPTAKLGVRLEVYDIHVSTIAKWNWEDRESPDKLTGITQRTTGKGVKIPIEDLAIITVGQPWPVGFARLRPAVFWYATAKQVIMAFSEQARAASGMLIVELSNIVSKEQMTKAVNLIVDIQTEEGSRGIAVGGNSGVKGAGYHFPSTIFDPTIYLHYFDGQVDQLMMSALQSLGLTAGSGSRALGDNLEVADRDKWNAALNGLGRKWGRAVFGYLAKLASGPSGQYVGRLPRLHVADIEASPDPTETVQNTVAAVGAGLMTVDQDVKDEIRKVTVGWGEADAVKLSALKSSTEGRITLKAGGDELPPTPEFLESLRGMTMDELTTIGLAHWDGDGLMLFPKGWHKHVPSDFEVIDIFGEETTKGNMSGDQRYGFLAYGILASDATGEVEPPPAEPIEVDIPSLGMSSANPDVGDGVVAHSPTCGCTDHLQLARPKGKYLITDAWGDSFTSSKPEDQLSPGELGMRLGAWEDARVDLDARVTEELANVTATVRGNVTQALDTLPDDTSPRGSEAIDAVMSDAKERYRAVVERFSTEAQEITATLGADERERAAGSAVDVPQTEAETQAQTDELNAWVEETNARITKQIDGSADRMASRVVGEMLDTYDTNPDLVRPDVTYVTRISDAGIAREASAPVTSSENLGRVEQAITPDPDGLVVTALTRTYVRDANACDTCISKDGYLHPEIGHVEFPRDLSKYRASSDFTFPDMTCDGRQDCRCDVTITYGRPIAA